MQPCRTCLARTQELIELCPLTDEHCEIKRRARKQAHIVEKPEEPHPRHQRRQAKAAAR
jgi:hypothetical protein